MNTDKSTCSLNEKVELDLASLDLKGNTLCHSNLKLTIKSPSGKETELTTQNQQITTSSTCSEDNNATDDPDYRASFVPNEEGVYKLNLIDLNTKNNIEGRIEVKNSQELSLTRKGATRLNPFKAERFSMTLTVKAQNAYTGQIEEHIPSSFNIIWQGPSKVEVYDDYKSIVWDVELKAGESKDLIYEYQIPKLGPASYLLGPVWIAGQQIPFMWRIVSNSTI
jgi:hypothetical protein